LALGNDPGLKGAITVTGDINREVSTVIFYCFCAGTVTGITAVIARWRMFIITQMAGYLALHGAFDQGFGQLFDKPVFAQQVFGVLIILH